MQGTSEKREVQQVQITSGRIQGAQKCVIYGAEGIGKSTLASRFPSPVFCDTEGSTKLLDVRRTPKPNDWPDILEQVKYFINHPDELQTFVLDTADWAERLCVEHVCDKALKDGLESFGYGKGYVYLGEEFGRLLNLLEELINRGVHVVVTAHAKMRKFEQPDEMGAYDRWEMKLSKTVAPLVKEWADVVLFANYKTIVVNVDGQGTQKGKNKAQGGQRVLRTSHHPCWDAKNRHELPDELPMDFKKIAHIFTERSEPNAVPTMVEESEVPTSPAAEEPAQPDSTLPDVSENIPEALWVLMHENDVQEPEIRQAVAERGYYPEDVPITDYDPDFIQGVLIDAWLQVYSIIEKNRGNTPF